MFLEVEPETGTTEKLGGPYHETICQDNVSFHIIDVCVMSANGSRILLTHFILGTVSLKPATKTANFCSDSPISRLSSGSFCLWPPLPAHQNKEGGLSIFASRPSSAQEVLHISIANEGVGLHSLKTATLEEAGYLDGSKNANPE